MDRARFPVSAAFARAACAMLLALTAAACTSLETRIAEPRSRQLLDAAFVAEVDADLGIERRSFRVPDGPELAYRIVEPKAYGMAYRYTRTDTGARFNFRVGNPSDERMPVPAAGTLVLLHGWSMDGNSMLPWALSLAEHGWRGLVVDLRNHGDSGRAPAGYGPREGRDVAALVAALRESGQIDGPLALFGVSFGAVAALYAGAELGPGNVDAVVAMAPYANAADGIRDMIEGMKAQPAAGLRGRLVVGHARRRYDDARIAGAVNRAGGRLGVDLAAVDVRQAAAAIPACTLLLHGTNDGFFPMEAVRSLAEAAPRGQLMPLDGEHHFTAPMRVDWLAQPLADWLDAVAGNGCPEFVLPAPPASGPEDGDA